MYKYVIPSVNIGFHKHLQCPCSWSLFEQRAEETPDTAFACIVFLSHTAHSSQSQFFQMPINRCEKCYFLPRDRCLHNSDTILAIQSAA